VKPLIIAVIISVVIAGLFLPPEVDAKQAYKTYNLKSWNVGIDIDQYWRIMGITDTEYYPGITIYDAWYKGWEDLVEIALFHNVGQSINLQNFDEVTQYYEDYQRQWCADTLENPVWEVSPTEKGWTKCLKIGNFTSTEIIVDGRQAYQISYQINDEFRLPGGQFTKDIFSSFTIWENLIPYGDDLIIVSGGTIDQRVDDQKELILGSINSFKILNDGKPIFDNTEPPRQSDVPPPIMSMDDEITTKKIPDWVKNNAGWWADGSIDDNAFVQGIQYLIQEKIMNIPDLPEQASTAKEAVPDWVKNNAGWWAEGVISEDEFVNGIKFLVEKGIISVN